MFFDGSWTKGDHIVENKKFLFLCLSWGLIIISIHYCRSKVLMLTTLIKIIVWILLTWLQTLMNLQNNLLIGNYRYFTTIKMVQKMLNAFWSGDETWIHVPNYWLSTRQTLGNVSSQIDFFFLWWYIHQFERCHLQLDNLEKLIFVNKIDQMMKGLIAKLLLDEMIFF